MSAAARPWIPPWALAGAQLAHGLSWPLLYLLAARGTLGFSLPGLAWVHLVALGWLTLAALAVLVHVIPGFLGAAWRWPGVARWSLLPYGLGVAGMVAGFWIGDTALLAWSAAVVAAALAAYLAAAFATLLGFRPPDLAEARVRRAFLLVLVLLAAAAGFGVAMAWALRGVGPGWLLTVSPPIHAHLAVLGWLTQLILGVSVRTVRPITGGRSPAPWRHVAASTLLLAGLLLLLAGLGGGWRWLVWAGAAACLAGAALYALDMAQILARATVTHRPPQAFLAAATLWFLLAAGLGAFVLAGRSEWQAAYAFVALAGWLGQMVNGHLHHIGVRLLITLARGDDDETLPGDVLTAPLSWLSFGVFQAAVAVGTWGLVAGLASLVEAAAVAGFIGWLAMVANILVAWRRATRNS